jgi:glyceraldehyde-3-phosphate dehydrogenase/erythrose-4-phosphate dehydrogenase
MRCWSSCELLLTGVSHIVSLTVDLAAAPAVTFAQAYMFKYDSVHGRYDGSVEGTAEGLVINGNMVKTFAMM